jgi:glutaredoxin
MKHVQFPPIADASVSPLGSALTSNPGRGLLLRFVEALHESRRLQAARIIERHRHLIDRAHKAEAAKAAVASSPSNQVPNIVLETADAGSSSNMSFNAKLIMAIVLAGFVVLHFGADAALRHATAATQPAEDNMPLANRD